MTDSSSSSVKSEGIDSRASGGILEIVSGGIDLRNSGIVSGRVGVDVAFLVKKDLKNWLA